MARCAALDVLVEDSEGCAHARKPEGTCYGLAEEQLWASRNAMGFRRARETKGWLGLSGSLVVTTKR